MRLWVLAVVLLLLYNIQDSSASDRQNFTYAMNAREKMVEHINTKVILSYFRTSYVKGVEVTTLVQQNTIQSGGVLLEDGDKWDDYCIVIHFNSSLQHADYRATLFPMHFMSLRVLYYLNVSDISANYKCLRPVADQVMCRDGSLASFGGPNCMPMCGSKYNCSGDLMRCPDGGWVSRDGPDCSFECKPSSVLTGGINEEQAKIAARKLQADIYFANTGAIGVSVKQIGTIAKRVVEHSLDNIPFKKTESVADYALHVWCYGWCSLNAPNPLFVYDNIRVFHDMNTGWEGWWEETYCPGLDYFSSRCTVDFNCTKTCPKRSDDSPVTYSKDCQDIGQYCSKSDPRSCKYGLYCERSSSTCKPKYKTGEVCPYEIVENNCESDYARCLPKVLHVGESTIYHTFEEVYTCQLLHYKRPGENCNADYECMFGEIDAYYNDNNSTCVDGRCYGRAEGEKCFSSTGYGVECLPGLYCDYIMHDCQKLKIAGENCTESQQCESGVCIKTDSHYMSVGFCQTLHTETIGTYCEGGLSCSPELKAFQNCMRREREQNLCNSQTYCRNCAQEYKALKKDSNLYVPYQHCDIMSRDDYYNFTGKTPYNPSTPVPTYAPLPVPKQESQSSGSNLVMIIIVVAVAGGIMGVLLFAYLYKTNANGLKQTLKFGKIEFGVVSYEKLNILNETPQKV